MLRSLYSAISGLRADSTELDVTANNIANSSTVGYKSSSAIFSDTLSQMLTAAGSPSTASAGTNPVQIGLGVQVAGIGTNWTQGSTETTGNATDMMISGDGFFVVDVDGTTQYTRAGEFTFDANGTLETASGGRVQGYLLDSSGAPTGSLTDITKSMNIPTGRTLASYGIGKDGVLTGTLDDGSTVKMGQIALANFTNPAGLEKVGDTSFVASNNSGVATIGTPNSSGFGKLSTGTLEASNVDLSLEFTNLIIAQRGYQANARVITTSDSVLEELVNLKR